MAEQPSVLRRNLFIALLVLMTFLPLFVYFYARTRGKGLAEKRLIEHVEQSVNRTLELKRQLEETLARSDPSSDAAAADMTSLVVNDESIAYIQLADRDGRIVNSTAQGPRRERVDVLAELPPGSPDIAAPEVVRNLRAPDGRAMPEFVVDLRLPDGRRSHMLVGMSSRALDEQLRQFQMPVRWSALQVAVLCVAILAGFSAYIVYLNEKTRSLHAALEEEQRLAYVGTLAASIAHEVRNPLSSVKMNVQMIERRLERLGEPGDVEYFQTKVERIQSEVDRLEESVSHFLAFARPAPLRAQLLALNEVVDGVLDFLEPQCREADIELVRDLAGDLPPVEVDPNQIAQALQNLVLNAVQAIGTGGRITVRTAQSGGAVVLAVADDGPGIPPEDQEHVFDVFYTTREGGTGLGLNIVSRIVDEHGGHLSLDSAPGQGTTFRIALPPSRADRDEA
ncbi:MAG: two-component system sensor histidine kinase NtrB [Planctomycetota bacterium]